MTFRIDIPRAYVDDPHEYAARHHAREIMAAGGTFSMAVYRYSGLSLREFEAARTRIAEINGCLICQRFRAARDAATMFATNGMRPTRDVTGNGPAPDEAFYTAVADWRTAPGFSDRERLAIEFAEGFAEEPKIFAADEDFWSRAHALFEDGELVDLAHCVAAWIGLGRVAHVLGFDSACAVASDAAVPT
jgi:alkylhydroperoxidase family enzyme